MNEETLNLVIFVGQTLGPFFLEDPKTGNAQQMFEALADTDPHGRCSGYLQAGYGC